MNNLPSGADSKLRIKKIVLLTLSIAFWSAFITVVTAIGYFLWRDRYRSSADTGWSYGNDGALGLILIGVIIIWPVLLGGPALITTSMYRKLPK